MRPTGLLYDPYTTVRDVDLFITFDITNRQALNNATISSTDSESISNLSQIKNDFEDVNYATCEDGLVKLDGTWKYLNNTITDEHIGWWSASLSNENGEFTTPPKLNINISSSIDAVGFMLYFAKANTIEEYILTLSSNNDIIYKETFSGEIADIPVHGFNKIEISVIKTKEPYRRVKLNEFMVGVLKKWSRDSIINASVTEEVSINGETLPINELSFEVDNTDGAFDIYRTNKKFVYKYAERTATLSQQHGGAISKLFQVNDLTENIYNYATCEDGLVKLDGTWKYLPSGGIPNSYQIGYINDELSDSQSEYSGNPHIEYSWDTPIDISGIKIFFGKFNYASKIVIRYYRSGSLVSWETVDNNYYIADIDFGASNCDNIVIEFTKSIAPNRFIKVSDIQMMISAESWGSFLTKNQNISVKAKISNPDIDRPEYQDDELISLGEAYLFDSLEQNNGGLTVKITAKDYTSQLNHQKCPDGSIGTGDITLSDALNGVIGNGTGIEVIYIPSTLANTTVKKTAPKDTTKRAAIHYFSQASCATCYLNRDKKLVVKSLDIPSSIAFCDYLNFDNTYNKDTLKIGEFVNMIRLSVKNTYVDPETETRYFGGSGLYYREIENDCVYASNGQAVADWLLAQAQKRKYFEITYRGNPALELGDIISVLTKNGTNYPAMIYYQNFEYDGGLKATLRAVIV